VALADLVEEGPPASGEHRVHDQAKLIQQLSPYEAGHESRAADHVDRFAGLLAQCTDLVHVANDPRRRPGHLSQRR
jgi:hypothetical protein